MTFMIGDTAANVSIAAALRSVSSIAIARAKNNLEHVMVRSEYCKFRSQPCAQQSRRIDLLTDAGEQGWELLTIAAMAKPRLRAADSCVRSK